jgi:hypothetical protein
MPKLETSLVISHIDEWGFGGGSYISMQTLTNKTRFGVIYGCQEQICEARGLKRIISY